MRNVCVLRRSVVAICILPSPVSPWLRTAGRPSGTSTYRPAHGQARTLRDARWAQGGGGKLPSRQAVAWVSSSGRDGRLDWRARVHACCDAWIQAVEESESVRSLCAYILCSNSSSFPHRRRGFRLAERGELHRSNSRWLGHQSKVANLRRRSARALPIGDSQKQEHRKGGFAVFSGVVTQ